MGLRELALQNLSKSHYAAERFQQAGAKRRFTGPFFNELVIQGVGRKASLRDRLAQEKIIGGLELGRYYPEFGGDVLLCFTETVAREKIDQLVELYAR